MSVQTQYRDVPTKYVEEMKLESVKRLTFRDRLKLLLGYNLLFTAVIKTQHRTGKTHQLVGVELTEREPDPLPKSNVLFVEGRGV